MKKLEEQERPAQELNSMKIIGCASKQMEGRDQGIKKIIILTPFRCMSKPPILQTEHELVRKCGKTNK